ncbi:unnamed protein product [Larinioides sclopetarius]|uniref:Uncharacterized protein n=1 Tax=Larinioides sclopetarius TaxID=280406 RepID=A0AAV2BUY3_9ARAC
MNNNLSKKTHKNNTSRSTNIFTPNTFESILKPWRSFQSFSGKASIESIDSVSLS